MGKSDRERRLFTQLLAVLEVGALQQMGFITNPITGEQKRDLDVARDTIDTLEMLKRKMGGNLSEDEVEIMEKLLASLRLRYVEIMHLPEAREGNEASPEK